MSILDDGHASPVVLPSVKDSTRALRCPSVQNRNIRFNHIFFPEDLVFEQTILFDGTESLVVIHIGGECTMGGFIFLCSSFPSHIRLKIEL